MLCINRHLVTFLFSIYFILYAPFPVCFAEDRLIDNNSYAYQRNLKLKSIHAICSLISPEYSPFQYAEIIRTNIQYIIEKAKTLVNSDNNADLTPQESAGSNYKFNTLYQNFITSIEQHTTPECRRGFCCSASGLSPPLFCLI